MVLNKSLYFGHGNVSFSTLVDPSETKVVYERSEYTTLVTYLCIIAYPGP